MPRGPFLNSSQVSRLKSTRPSQLVGHISLRPQILRRSPRARRFAPARSCPRPPLPPVDPRFPRLPRSRVPHERRDVSRPPHRLLMRDARDLRPPGALGDAPMRALDPRPRRAPRAHPPPSTKRQASACACMLPPCVMMRERMIRLDGRIRGPCLHDHQHLVMASRKMVMDLHPSSSSSSSTFVLDAPHGTHARIPAPPPPTPRPLTFFSIWDPRPIY